jgi:hypothetical protein
MVLFSGFSGGYALTRSRVTGGNPGMFSNRFPGKYLGLCPEYYPSTLVCSLIESLVGSLVDFLEDPIMDPLVSL